MRSPNFEVRPTVEWRTKRGALAGGVRTIVSDTVSHRGLIWTRVGYTLPYNQAGGARC